MRVDSSLPLSLLMPTSGRALMVPLKTRPMAMRPKKSL